MSKPPIARGLTCNHSDVELEPFDCHEHRAQPSPEQAISDRVEYLSCVLELSTSKWELRTQVRRSCRTFEDNPTIRNEAAIYEACMRLSASYQTGARA